MTERRIRVAVIMGGRSSEHEISLASARSVVDALDPARYETVEIEIGREGRWALPSGNGRVPAALDPGSGPRTGPGETLPVPAESRAVATTLGGVDVVLPILHGPFGEDGTVQGLLELADVPYVGAGHGASYVCMDKDVFKSVMRDKGIPVTQSVTLREGDEIRNPFGYPVFVKPSQLGSSIGISKVREESELEEAVALARRHGEKVLVEEFVEGTEIEVGVLGNQEPIASLPGQVVAHFADWYDYSSKYDEGGSDLLVPPPGLSQEQIERAQTLAVDAFRATDCEGMVRADMFVRADDGQVVVNELNTIPGFTDTSFYARLFEASGVPYPKLVDRLIELAIERHERRQRYLF
ncbi:MAG TPA: D-alanine--D-alanine ligase family protein [Gaiellaceae bacterium]